MEKKYVVRLTGDERNTLSVVVSKLSGSSQKVKRAQILLKTDADGAPIGQTSNLHMHLIVALRLRILGIDS